VLKVEEVSGYLRVTGYPDGSDWLFRPEPPRMQGYGTVGPEHVWCIYAQSGRLQLYHAITRRPSATAKLGAFDKHAGSIPITGSRDGRRIFVVQSDETESSLKVVDVATGEVTAVHSGLPRYLPRRPVERPDGTLLLEDPGRGLILLNPATGERQDSSVPGIAGFGFLSASPDSRYWVRFDPTTLPTHDTAPSLLGRLSGKGTERLYGLTVQLWEAFPLRFVRRVVVGWLKVEELPDETHLRNPAGRRAVWEAVAAAAAAANAGPLDSPAPRAVYPAPYSTDDAAWKAVEANVATLVRDWVRVTGWQPDGAAWWVSTHSFLSCAGVDGAVSPRLYTERLGLEAGTWLPVAAYWKEVVPLDGRKARVIYAKGEALFDGAPTRSPHLTVAIPTDRDQWRDRADPMRSPERTELFRRIAALKDERSTVTVSLAGWAEADCVAAIEALTAKVEQGVVHAAGVDDQKVRIVFDLKGERIGESRFFSEAGERFPGVAPALRRLIERYTEVSGPNRSFHFDRETEAGVLSRAVRALGVLDLSALETLERYGLLVDAEHEYYFAGTTVPDVIKAHGWTDDVVDFVFWVLVRNYYNTLQHYGHVWDEWGLRDAVVAREPRTFARHLASVLTDIITWKDDPGRYGTAGLDQLAAQIPKPHEAWAQTFFGELERIAVEVTNA
jgi:hypothetical protein